ncbi:Cysteine proteinase Cathepsin L [Handroanthus impetiginosus]|uniref:Cysteine proteinase Cathepsin L n=1 Tax=Handroanthus impetiginosus TaxID=429701 RepID=A0A2G9HVY8_9LAMI|nr:Cysteine proteinase Cathepsin L [Handroanthus impetiginosus]
MNWLWPFLHLILLFSQLPTYKSSSVSDLFDSWCKEYGKTYASEQEKAHRLKVFEENYEFVTRHNTRGNSSYTLGLNAFADLTNQEFKARYLGLSPSADDLVIRLNSRSVENEGPNLMKESDIPSSLDWRKKGAVTGVKDQGSCGACWSFSATGAVEGINQIVTGSLVSLSEQELIDCDKSYNDGCGGGLMDYAYEFIINNKGIDTEEDYPYRGRDGTCNRNKLKRRVVTIDSYTDIPSGNEKKLQQAVATQPISVGISGSDTSFQLYSGGIFTGPCSTSLDHAVLIVGYDSKDGTDYWIIKNSWGKYWGINGYMHMIRNTRNAEGVCGINTLASYPIKTSPNPPPSPSPGPTRCSLFTYCSSGETCCCAGRFLGICLSWKCCAAVDAVCCKDHRHCCPHDYPICDTERNLCLKRIGNSTLVEPLAKKSFSVS